MCLYLIASKRIINPIYQSGNRGYGTIALLADDILVASTTPQLTKNLKLALNSSYGNVKTQSSRQMTYLGMLISIVTTSLAYYQYY